MDPRLQHATLKIKELVDDYRAGKIVIPEFQRDYVWKPSKAPKLIDSLYQGFPISSLLLWDSTEHTRARRKDPRPSRQGMMSWLIDGQQRVITLARTMAGDEGIEVMFNPDRGEFKLANAATRQDRDWFRVADLWENDTYLAIRRTLDGERTGNRRELAFERVRKILDYEVPVVRMVDHAFVNAVDAFTRINTHGVRLKHEDVESAKVAARHTGFISEEVIPFLQKLRSQGFTRLNIMHLFRACAFIATPDGRSRTPLHELDSRQVLAAWKSTVRATELAIGIIRSELGLVNMNVLWSGSLIVPLTAICATEAPRARDAKGLVGWLALAALLHRYSGSSETALDQDLRACRQKDPLGALLSNLRGLQGRLLATEQDFAGGLADRSGLLAVYIACQHRGVLDFFTGGKVLLQDSVDRHHILARSQFEAATRAQADNIANIAFIAGGSNRSLSSSGPEIYLAKLSAKVRKSQCIPEDKRLWTIERAEGFWEARRELLAESFNEFVKEALEGRHLKAA